MDKHGGDAGRIDAGGGPPPLEKLCPVLLRISAAGPLLLVFRHPLAGVQLVKGTREAGESVAAGALRELEEESGISGRVIGTLGSSTGIMPDQLWHFVLVEAGALADSWSFDTADDGGHRFAFFWWPLQAQPGPDWHASFVLALGHIRQALG
jgi:8-oxo-dGTP pyrophosphatase MutT (NUDIX family)